MFTTDVLGQDYETAATSCFRAYNLVIMKSKANAANSIVKASNSITKAMKFNATATNSIAKSMNSTAKVPNSTFNGTNTTAKVPNSTANGKKITAKVTNSIVKSCNKSHNAYGKLIT